ncbi:MAG: DUF3179 domain-containing protein, partial [Bacteroidota bacterium]
IFCLLAIGCSQDNGSNVAVNSNCNFGGDWLIPIASVFDGGPGCDGIPSIDNPAFIPQSSADFMRSNDLVLAAQMDGETKLYAHPILDWHEIINDRIGNQDMAIVYCPLTGTGIGWDRELANGENTTFGVSGVLYNNNIVPYDRLTGSNWSQQLLQCVNGELIGERPTTFNLVEMRWEDAQSLFPDALVSSDQTGFNRDYLTYPYGDYRTNNDNLIFPLTNDDDRLPSKDRVLGVIDGTTAKAYQFTDFAEQGWSLIEDELDSRQLVLIGSQSPEIINVFDRVLSDGTVLNFTLLEDAGAELLQDQEGNIWNLFGTAVSGPRMGQQLVAPTAFIGYWFSWGAFYPDIELYVP